jgi:hypothetical protein
MVVSPCIRNSGKNNKAAEEGWYFESFFQSFRPAHRGTLILRGTVASLARLP